MKVLFASLRNTSHFLPLVPFIRACRARGHEVAVAAPEDLRERVQGAGAALLAVAHPGDEGLRPFWMRMREVAPADANRVVVSEIFAGICARTALPSLLELAPSFRPDVIVRESMEFASLIAAERLGIPHARVGIIARGAERELLSVAAPALDELRAGVGLPADPSARALAEEPVLTLFPASFDDHPAEGPVLRFRATRASARPLPSYWPNSAGPLVYVTFGTVVGGMDVLRSAYRVALEAVRTLPARVLLTVGNDLPLDALGEVPSHVHVERFVPQDDVLPHAAAVVCHGGSGTVLGTLAAGVPMVVSPMFADQPYNAARVQALGAGLALATGANDPAALRAALDRVLAEPSFRTAAERLAAEIGALPVVDEAALALERLR